MGFLKKIVRVFKKDNTVQQKQPIKLSIDDLFVQNFIEKGGKFLYSTEHQEVVENLKKVLIENNWSELFLLDKSLANLVDQKTINLKNKYQQDLPIFTTCEHLISQNGDILFSSNQLGSKRLPDYPKNFIVFATTSQIVKNSGQGLTGIKINYKNCLPNNISAITNFTLNNLDDNFLNYGNNNSKNLYLLLLENL